MNSNELVETLKQKYQEAVAENAKLVKTIRTLTGADLSQDDRAILEYLDSSGEHIPADKIARHFSLPLGKTEYILGRLIETKHIRMDARTPTGHTIEQKGRMVVHGINHTSSGFK